MKRTIYIITLGYIIGIIGELLIKKVSLFVLFLIIITTLLKCFNINIHNKFYRIIKVFIKNNIILLFLISCFFGNIRIMLLEKKYENIYKNFKKETYIATVISNKKESQYTNTYKIKLYNSKIKNMYFLLRVPKKEELEYGEKIKFKGEYTVPEDARNYKGFSYKDYLKEQKICGIVEADEVEKVSKNQLSKINLLNNNIKQKIISNTRKILPNQTQELLLGILIGYDRDLQEDISEYFDKSSLNHLLAVSGLHISYLSIGILSLLKMFKISKKARIIIFSVFLVNFMFIIDFSPSVIRAGIMSIVSLFSIISYRKNDVKTTLSIPLILITIDNPYKIFNIGLILSYLATIGIITGTKLIKKIKVEGKIKKYIISTLEVAVIANIFIIPFIAISFNTISFSFLISSILTGFIIGPIVILGFLLIIISFLNLKTAYLYGTVYNIILNILILISKFISKFEFLQFTITTPSIISVIIYYLLIYFIFIYIYLIKKFSNRFLVKKIIKLKEKIIKYIKHNFKKVIVIIFIIILFLTCAKIMPGKIKIYFIDVGQGDSTLIVTPNHKKILIDGGGAENYDVGENILVPYLLDRKIKKIDYIIISHMDTDHVRTGF